MIMFLIIAGLVIWGFVLLVGFVYVYERTRNVAKMVAGRNREI